MPSAQPTLPTRQQEEDYINAAVELASIPVHGELKDHVKQLTDEVIRLKKLYPEMTVDLTTALNKTHDLLSNPLTYPDYEVIAKTMHGQSSPMMNALGFIMLALCAASVALATVIAPIGVVVLATTFSVASAFCFFAGRRHSLSEAMHNLADDKATELSYKQTSSSPSEFSV